MGEYFAWIRGETVMLNDGEIAEIVHGDAFQRAIASDGMRRDRDDVELHGAVEAIAKIIRG